MDSHLQTLVAQSLALIGLLAATIEYCEIIRRRKAERIEVALRTEAADLGLRGLVRLFLTPGESGDVPSRDE